MRCIRPADSELETISSGWHQSIVTEKAAQHEEGFLAEYRVDAGFVSGYLLAYVGILGFGWDPRLLFLGVSLEIALANIGLIVRAFMTARSIPPMLIATALCLPALLGCIALATIPAGQINAGHSIDAAGSGSLLLGGFLLGVLFSEFQRFRRITLPQARFTRYFDDKYVFEDGRPVFNGVSHVLSSVIGSWLLTGVFVVSWLIAVGLGGIQAGDGQLGSFNRISGSVLLTLCLLRQLMSIGILRYVYRKRPSQEELFLKTFSQAGTIVLRNQ